jgi:surface protein
MFNASSMNQDISLWDVSSVTEMGWMFFSSFGFNQDIRWWNVSHLASEPTGFSDYSQLSSANKPLWGQTLNYYPLTNSGGDPTYSTWRNSYAPAGGYRFKPNDGIYTLPGEPITNMYYMFNSSVQFNDPDIGLWDVSSVTNMSYTFYACHAFNQDIGSWNVSSVSSMQGMFAYCYVFNQDLTGWCVTNITSEPSAYGQTNFSMNSALTAANKPVWGTCP